MRRATLALVDVMDAKAVNERVLADRLGVSRQLVNTWFAGGIRTIKALAAAADAVGCDVHIELRGRVEELAS